MKRGPRRRGTRGEVAGLGLVLLAAFLAISAASAATLTAEGVVTPDDDIGTNAVEPDAVARKSVKRCMKLLERYSTSDGVYPAISFDGTVFCPTNHALNVLAVDLGLLGSRRFFPPYSSRFDQLLRNIIGYHVVPLASSGGQQIDLTTALTTIGQTIVYTNKKGAQLTVTATSILPVAVNILGGTIQETQEVVISPALATTFGLNMKVYGVNAVIMPPNTYMRVADALGAFPRLSYMAKWSKRYTGVFGTKACTIFAPTNPTWDALGTDSACTWSWFVSSDKLKTDKALQSRVVAYHIYTDFADTVSSMFGVALFTRLRAGAWLDTNPSFLNKRQTRESLFVDYASDGVTPIVYGSRNWYWFIEGFNLVVEGINTTSVYPVAGQFSDIPISKFDPEIRDIYAGSCVIQGLVERPLVPFNVGIKRYDTVTPTTAQQQQCVAGITAMLEGGVFPQRSGFSRKGVGSKGSRGGGRGYS